MKKLLELQVLRMSKKANKQKTISSFFKTSTKRTSSSDEPPPAKIAKVNDDNRDTNNGSLSPEQKKKMADNKLKAQKVLSSKTLEISNIGTTWKDALSAEYTKPYFQTLQTFVAAERKKSTIYPPENDVFSWMKYFDIKDTKVVIIGQDPYHGPNQAHGLCFSVQVGVGIPPSLLNMYKELETDIPGFIRPKHGHLVGWASQGVLLLNACLTVVAKNPNSHQGKGWEKFTDATIKWIDRNLEGVVFILWGKYAEKKGSFLDKKRHLVLTGRHPSPFSASRGFFGCKHFSKTNEYLKEQNKKEIDWTILPESID